MSTPFQDLTFMCFPPSSFLSIVLFDYDELGSKIHTVLGISMKKFLGNLFLVLLRKCTERSHLSIVEKNQPVHKINEACIFTHGFYTCCYIIISLDGGLI